MTLGYGPDFAVPRSRGVLLNIPRMVRELQEKMPEATINGSGLMVVVSIKFVGRLRTKIVIFIRYILILDFQCDNFKKYGISTGSTGY